MSQVRSETGKRPKGILSMARKCKECRTEIPAVKACTDFIGKKGYCGVDCMAAHGLSKARDAAAKKERKELKARKEGLKTRGDHAKDTQTDFNKFIRLRDKDKPCISCDTISQSIKWDAGHYRSVGACPELRYDELNVHRQCSKNCNVMKSGNAIEYRIRLVKRIGQDAVDYLEGPHAAAKYTIEELNELKMKYRGKWKELERNG